MKTNSELKELQNKNHFVFKKIFYEFYEDLVNYAHGYLFDKGRSEDMVQDVFITLWEKADTIEINTTLKGYLYAMVRNKSLNLLKSIKITDSTQVLELQAILDDTYNHEDTIETTNKIHNQLLNIIDTLPEKMQVIVKMRYLENYRYAEIAEELKISVNTVKTQLKRAKIKIGQLLHAILILLSIFH
ncbi:RNA polymerase sigma factor [Maribacter ulvicola]|uniref:RNA polymerase sigma-70 factor, ECF subfamily n=1 Tax=Maribacter ulvicola TaxID=228959 RepID=A0A1N6S4G1_9FLAO|nr:RNA polymerase sigma-70 factor [Maribacter ulvicola]SIQ36028.1 RNA polymerase sigma-70 factor, ECF subfamily [Maribacter ulvicola]